MKLRANFHYVPNEPTGFLNVVMDQFKPLLLQAHSTILTNHSNAQESTHVYDTYGWHRVTVEMF